MYKRQVVHFAAESHVDRSIRDPEVFVKTNVLGTLVMLNADVYKRQWSHKLRHFFGHFLMNLIY